MRGNQGGIAPILFVAGITGILLLASAGGVIFMKSRQAPSPQPSPQAATPTFNLKGTVVLLEGTLEKQQDGLWGALQKGAQIVQGDTLRTLANSRAIVELDDGSIVRLDQNAQITFTTLSDATFFLTQVKGKVFHRVNPGKLTYNVKSLNTTATALGTSFAVETDDDLQRTAVAVLESKVAVSTESEQKTVIETGQVASITDNKTVAIAAIPKETLENDFYKWNAEQDKAHSAGPQAPTPSVTVTPKATLKPTAKAEVSGFSLKAEPKEGGVMLTWTFSGSAPKGFKVLRSKTANPTFPPRDGDHSAYLDNPDSRSYFFSNLSGTYHFRVGVYTGDGVSTYSNNATATGTGVEKTEKKEYSSTFTGTISLSASSNEPGKVSLNWTVNGSGGDGFKICKSEAANPKYGEADCDFVGTADRSKVWEGFPSGTTYHFRVGGYAGGKVAENAYSNDVAVTIK